jgi:hypothetical protein
MHSRQSDEHFAEENIMNTRTRTLIATAWVAAAATFSAQAADQDASFTQQLQITDGYYPQYTVHPTERQAKPETERQAREDAFLEEQAEITDGYYPQYPVHPTARLNKPETVHQAQEDVWFARERAMGSGSVAPVRFPVPPVAGSAPK